jgi:hypothetical protein
MNPNAVDFFIEYRTTLPVQLVRQYGVLGCFAAAIALHRLRAQRPHPG